MLFWCIFWVFLKKLFVILLELSFVLFLNVNKLRLFGENDSFFYTRIVSFQEMGLLSCKVIILVPFSHALQYLHCINNNGYSHGFQVLLNLFIWFYFDTWLKIIFPFWLDVWLFLVVLTNFGNGIVNCMREKLIIFVVIKLSTDEEVFIKHQRVHVNTCWTDLFLAKYLFKHFSDVLFGFRIGISQLLNVNSSSLHLFSFD